MGKRHYRLTEDEKKERWAKVITSFILIGVLVTLFFFFTVVTDDEMIRWSEYTKYFGGVVNPAGALIFLFFIFWPLALLEYHLYLKQSYAQKSSARIILNKVADKVYDLIPGLFLIMGGCILTTTILEYIYLPYNSHFWIYYSVQLLVCIVASVTGFVMFLPRRLMLHTVIILWLQFCSNAKKLIVLIFNH